MSHPHEPKLTAQQAYDHLRRHEDRDWTAVFVLITSLLTKIGTLEKELKHMSAKSDALKSAIADLTTAINTALPLIDPGTDAVLDAATAQLQALTASVVAASTPAAPAPVTPPTP